MTEVEIVARILAKEGQEWGNYAFEAMRITQALRDAGYITSQREKVSFRITGRGMLKTTKPGAAE